MSDVDSRTSKNELIALVIFGVTGDLTRRKLIPAIYQLYKDGQLPQKVKIIGFARRQWTDEIMREYLRQGIAEFSRSQPVDEKIVENLLKSVRYVQSTFEEDQGYKEILNILVAEEFCGVLYYLATPPNEYLKIIQQIGKNELNSNKCWSQIVIEKLFGNDLFSVLDLENNLHLFFTEDEIFRIDHYLGKETVQNILV
ncbi:glucose-6-phosphate dehydrogenase, partial [bacterium]|nr:glucose-6-phosphate dehydrogenase [bacterium]